MATVKKWINVQVAIQSALGAAKTITNITKASPGVVSSTGHGIANGEYATFSVQGMGQVNNRVFRGANVTADTLELESQDTTLFDTFVSGTLNEITFGITMSTVLGLAASGGEFDFEDITTIHDTQRNESPGLPSAARYSTENIWDISDAALVELKAASDLQARRAIRFSFADGTKMVFLGYVGANLLPGGNAFEVIKTPVVFTMQGTPTFYTS
jgi:hypothetical protein